MLDRTVEEAAREGTPALANPSPSREKILEVCEALFARRGYAGVGMREVASEVGLGKSSLFHHFPSKALLYLSVLERVLERIALHLGPALHSPAGPVDKLEAWVHALVDALAEQPGSARLLLRALFEEDAFPESVTEKSEELEQVLAGILGGFQLLVKRGIESGDFRRVSVAHATQTMIGATVYHFASGELGEGMVGAPIFSAAEVRRRKQEVTEFLKNGLAAAPEPERA